MKYSNFRVIAMYCTGLETVIFRGSPQDCIDFLCQLPEPEEGWQYGLGYTEHEEV